MTTATASVGVESDLAQVMEAMPYGVYVVGSSDADHELNGMIADWVMQVSFNPRIVAVSFENDAHTLANIRGNGWFTVNLLPATDEGRREAARFLQPYDGAKVLGRTDGQKGLIHHKMDGVAHSLSFHGGPVLSASMAWFECEAKEFLATGDHTLVLGEVRDGRFLRDAEALNSLYTGWTYSG